MPIHRVPKGYLGIDHETIGRSIVALQTVLKQRNSADESDPRLRLGPIDPEAWYPIGLLLDSLDRLERTGRIIFQMSHAATVSTSQHCARDVLHGFDALYRRSNRGRGIGGWRVVRCEPGNAEVEKTTPHHCAMEQGILSAALAAVGCSSIVGQTACVREGADTCRFVISSLVTDSRWSGKREPR
jgi:hypothetical protein